MAKKKRVILSMSVLCAVFLTACQNPINDKTDLLASKLSPAVSFGSDHPKDAAVSFQADVEVYSSNDRSIEPPRLQNTYRISAKTIDDQVYTRIDIPGDLFPDGNALAMISDGLTMRYVNIESMETIARVNMEEDEVLGRLSGDITKGRKLMSFFGHEDIPVLMNKFRTLSFDITEENNGKGLTVELPASYLSRLSRPGFKLNRAKLYYDTESDTYAGAEAETVLEDGAVLKIVSRPVYETIEGVLLKVGEVNIKTYDYPEEETDFEAEIQNVNSIDDITELSDSDIEDLESEGANITPAELILGDPNDPDYTITEISVYNDIKVNTLEDSFFRIGE